MRKYGKPQTGPRRWGIKVLATAIGLFFVLGVGQVNAEEFTINCQGPGAL